MPSPFVLSIAPIAASAVLLATAAQAATPAVDPAAVAAADRMGDYLRSLHSFEATSSAVTEFVRADGQKTPVATTVTYKVRRPDGFLIELQAPEKTRRFIYDGRSFTVFAPKPGYFATVSAPPTIDQTVRLAYETYGVVLPLADLFYWGESARPTDGLTAARVVGREKIGGQETDHYLYAGQGLTWEVWIARGAQPLPLKMHLVTTDDPAKPSYTATLAWKPEATFPKDAFTFTPATDARPIAMARVDQ